MNIPQIAAATVALALFGAASVSPTRAQDSSPSPAAPVAPAAEPPNEAEMMAKMMELAKPGENHKVLTNLAGTWNYKVKFWMAADAPPDESAHGTAVCKPVMDGRYFVAEVNGKMQMPGPDGKLKETDFKGMAVDAYDNVKQKFISIWIDSMGTGVTVSEGTYDAATKTLTYHAEQEMMPGMKVKVREVIKFTDKDHHVFEWYEDRSGTETKTMEISYARKS